MCYIIDRTVFIIVSATNTDTTHGVILVHTSSIHSMQFGSFWNLLNIQLVVVLMLSICWQVYVVKSLHFGASHAYQMLTEMYRSVVMAGRLSIQL